MCWILIMEALRQRHVCFVCCYIFRMRNSAWHIVGAQQIFLDKRLLEEDRTAFSMPPLLPTYTLALKFNHSSERKIHF